MRSSRSTADRALDLLIANAGTVDSRAGGKRRATGAHGREMLVTDTIAPYLLAKSVLRQVAEASGKMIALTSGMGSIGESSGGYVPVSQLQGRSEHGVALARNRSEKAGAVAAVFDPGWVKTRMGGANAPTPPEQSVGDMRRLIEQLSLDELWRLLQA